MEGSGGGGRGNLHAIAKSGAAVSILARQRKARKRNADLLPIIQGIQAGVAGFLNAIAAQLNQRTSVAGPDSWLLASQFRAPCRSTSKPLTRMYHTYAHVNIRRRTVWSANKHRFVTVASRCRMEPQQSGPGAVQLRRAQLIDICAERRRGITKQDLTGRHWD